MSLLSSLFARTLATALTFNSAALHPKDIPPSDWGLKETSVSHAQQLATRASESQSQGPVVVAIIDTGADTKHPGLKNKIWTNPGETGLDAHGRDKATNGVDDDGNGYIDDVHGWNFVSRTGDVIDKHGHGTHIAGIIGGETTGVATNVSLMILKYYDPKSADTDPVRNTVRAIRYAIRMKAKIINYSAGGPLPSREERDAILEASRAGILFVAAAGNEGSDSDQHGYYPADYGLPNILSVTAIDSKQQILSSSNYGANTVALAAPGKDIESTLPGGRFGRLTGTSQATAFATGIAALLLTQFEGTLDPAKAVELLISSGQARAQLIGKTREATSINAYRALAMRDVGVSLNNKIIVNAVETDPRALLP